MGDEQMEMTPTRPWEELIARSQRRGRYLRRRRRVLATAPVLLVALAVAGLPAVVSGGDSRDRLEVATDPTPVATATASAVPVPGRTPAPRSVAGTPGVATADAPPPRRAAAHPAPAAQAAPTRIAAPAAPQPRPSVDALLFEELAPGAKRSNLALLTLGAGRSSVRITSGSGAFARPDFSPDGRRIVYQSLGRDDHEGWQIYVADADGRNERRLTRPVNCEQGETSPHCSDIEPQWAPTADVIAFTRGLVYPGCGGQLSECAAIHLVSPSTGRVERLVSGWAPSWSPDGSQLVYVALADAAEAATCERALRWTCNGTLHVVNRDGTQARSLGIKGYGPRWSPDGRWIVFEGDHTSDQPHQARLIRPDGTGLRDVLPAQYEHATWTPDGRLLSTLVRGGQRDIWISNADGTALQRLTFTPASESFPVFRPRTRQR